jgi:hypothetical protein
MVAMAHYSKYTCWLGIVTASKVELKLALYIQLSDVALPFLRILYILHRCFVVLHIAL